MTTVFKIVRHDICRRINDAKFKINMKCMRKHALDDDCTRWRNAAIENCDVLADMIEENQKAEEIYKETELKDVILAGLIEGIGIGAAILAPIFAIDKIVRDRA